MYKDKSIVFETSTMKHILKKTYFHDIYLFLKHVRNVISIKNEKFVHINFWICLKNLILEWWLFEFSKNNKRFVKLENKFDE